MADTIDWEYATKVEIFTENALYVWDRERHTLVRISEKPVQRVNDPHNTLPEAPGHLWPIRLIADGAPLERVTHEDVLSDIHRYAEYEDD